MTNTTRKAIIAVLGLLLLAIAIPMTTQAERVNSPPKPRDTAPKVAPFEVGMCLPGSAPAISRNTGHLPIPLARPWSPT